MEKYDAMICLEQLDEIESIVKELINKNLEESFNLADANKQEFINNFTNEIKQAVVRAFKSKGFHIYDEIKTSEVIEFADNLIFGRLKYKKNLTVNPKSPKLNQVKPNTFNQGNLRGIYSSPTSVKSLASSFIRVD